MLLLTLRLRCLNRLMAGTFVMLDKWFWRLVAYEFLKLPWMIWLRWVFVPFVGFIIVELALIGCNIL